MEENKTNHDLEALKDIETPNDIQYTENKGPWLGRRHIMIVMAALGLGLSLITSISFTVIIVAMTTQNTSSNPDIPVYDWNNKGVILSSGSWLGIPIQLFAGALERKYGYKWLILVATIACDVSFMLIPLFSKLAGSTGIIVCRVIQGGAFAMIAPILVAVNGKWIPVEERSTAGLIAAASTFACAIIGNVAAGQLVASSMGYPGCIYILGSVNLAWCIVWILFSQHSPATDSRITPEEKKYLEMSLNSEQTKDIPVPWKKMLTSLTFWAPVVAGIGSSWTDTIINNVSLIFVTNIWKVNVKESTNISGLASVGGFFIGAATAPLSDFLIKRKYIRVVNSRKIFQTVGLFGNVLCLLWMTWIPAGSSRVLMIFVMIVNYSFVIATSVGGATLNILDIAPAFAAIISGFTNTLSGCLSLISPMTIDWIVHDESDVSQWRIIFLIGAAIAVVTTIFFDIFATDKRQWDTPKDDHNNN